MKFLFIFLVYLDKTAKMLYYLDSTSERTVIYLAWKFESGTSLCEQISDKIRLDIIRGEYKPGEPFPTVRQLAFDAGVNPNTMQKALVALEAEGLLITLSTQGRIVTEDGELLSKTADEAKRREAKRLISLARSAAFERDELIQYIKEGWNDDE